MMTTAGGGDKSRISNVKYKTGNFLASKFTTAALMKSFITSCVRESEFKAKKVASTGSTWSLKPMTTLLTCSKVVGEISGNNQTHL